MATFQQFLAAQGLGFNAGAFLTLGAVDTITAHAGGGQGSAVALTGQINRISVCATAGDSVALPTTALVSANPAGPSGVGGLDVVVINSGAASLAVFPNTGDTINGGSANASVSIPAGGIGRYISVAAGAWFTGSGASASLGATTVTSLGGITTETFAPQVLAAVGATQGTAGLITKSRVIVTVTASTEGVKLPVAATGLEVHIMVPGTIGVKTYPNTNARIDAIATNVALALVAGKGNIYLARDTTRWVTIRSA